VGQPPSRITGRYSDAYPRSREIVVNDDMALDSNQEEEFVPSMSVGSPEAEEKPTNPLLEYWSMEDPDGEGGSVDEGAQLLTDGTGQVLAKSVHKNTSHSNLPIASVVSHHNHMHSGHAEHHATQKVTHQERNHDAANSGDSHDSHDRQPQQEEDSGPVAKIIVSEEENTFQPIALVGGVTAIFAQMYLWGNVFTTLFKSQRAEFDMSPRQQSQPRASSEQVQSRSPAPAPQAVAFSGASGRPGMAQHLPSQNSASTASTN